MFGILFLSLKRSLKRNLVNLIFPRGRVPGGVSHINIIGYTVMKIRVNIFFPISFLVLV